MSTTSEFYDYDAVPVEKGEEVLGEVASKDPDNIYAAVSGGDDSITALHFAHQSSEIELDGVLHVNTGFGIPKTREYVREQCEKFGLDFVPIGNHNARFSHERYETLVKQFGFPGATIIAHSQIRHNLKDKPFDRFRNHLGGDLALISGVRRFESERRYEKLGREGIQTVNGITWASPLVDFTDKDVSAYQQHHQIDENPVAALLCASGECMCLNSTTRISTERGWTTIEEVDEGDKVYSLQDGDVALTEVVEKHVQSPEEMFEIKPYYRPPIKATGNHPFYARPYEYEYGSDGNYQQKIDEAEWVDAGQIVKKTKESKEARTIDKERFYLGYPFRTGESQVNLSDSELRFLGYFISEGSFQWRPRRDDKAHGVTFVLSKESNELAQNIQDAFHECFPELRIQIEEKEDPRDSREYLVLRTGHSQVSSFVRTWVNGRYSPELELDERLMVASLDQQETLLSAMWEGDGSEYEADREHRNERVSAYTTASKHLALQVQEILLRMGEVYGINKGDNGAYIVRQSKGETRYGYIENGVLWCLVQSVGNGGKYKRYNLTVRDEPNFITESGLVHNCGAFEDRQNLPLLEEYFPRFAQKIFQLEWDVLERAARGEIKTQYALWAHGSVDDGEYAARTDVDQASLMCSDCEDKCPNEPYQITGNPLSPAEKYLQEHDLSELHQWPFYCAVCDLVVEDPLTHREEVHPFDADEGLAGEWDMRRIELDASHESGVIITEPNGWNIDPSQITRDEDEAGRQKHRYYYENIALSHCNDHDHSWKEYNGGPVKQCQECFAFNLSEYDPENPGPPTVENPDDDVDQLTPDQEEAQRIHQQLSEFGA